MVVLPWPLENQRLEEKKFLAKGHQRFRFQLEGCDVIVSKHAEELSTLGFL